MQKPDYVAAMGLLRVLEKRILSTADIGRVTDAPTPEEALRLISSVSEYDFSQLKLPGQYEQVLRPAQVEIFARCRDISPQPQPVDIIACRYLFHNLKTALKAKLAGAGDDGVYSLISTSDISPEELRQAVLGGGELPGYLAQAAAEAEDEYASGRNPQHIDLVVDKAQFARQLELAAELKSEFITGYIRRTIDYYNLLTTLRAKDMGQSSSFLGKALSHGGTQPREYFLEQFTKSVPAMSAVFFYRYFGKTAGKGLEAYQRTGNLAVLERLLDNDLIEVLRQSKLMVFGPEIVFCYLLAKENEIRQIRIIMAAKINKLSSERLSERLRENYV